MKTKNIQLKKFKIFSKNGIIGLSMKRDLTTKECRHIMSKILYIDISVIGDLDKEEYEDYNRDLCYTVNSWLRGDLEDQLIMDFADGCQDEPVGFLNAIPILLYLQKREII